jgi:hypothetical protein
MKRRRLSLVIAAIFALALGLGLGVSGAVSAAPAAPAVASQSLAPPVLPPYSEATVVINCQGHAQTRPGSFTLACADDNDYLTGLSWTSWTPKLASGYGTQHENDCIPYCAAGHFHSYPVLVVLWGTAALQGSPGTVRYTTITLLYTGARPEVYNGHKYVEGPATVTMSLWGPTS